MGAEIAPQIDFEDFLKLDIRVGVVRSCEPFPQARKPSYILTIDFGASLGTRKTSAQITRHYQAAEVIGRQVAAVVNLPPRQIGPMRSEVLLLGFPDDTGEVVLVTPNKQVPLGGRLF